MVNMNHQSSGVWYDGIALVRIAVGVMLVSDGWEVFAVDNVDRFADLLFNMSMPFPEAMAYTGKTIELVGGLFLILGLFTRLITAVLFITFMVLTFVSGEGTFLVESQLSFLYALISLSFFFTGAGRLSIDHILYLNRGDENKETGMAVNKRFGRYVSKS